MTDNASRTKDEELRIELLQTIFKFKKLANSGLGMKWVPRTSDDFSRLLKVRCRK